MKLNRLLSSFPDFDNKEEITLRDYLALERTRLANTRTLLSYIRTSLYLILGAIAFFKVEGLVQVRWLGYVSFALSALMILIAIPKYYTLKNKLNQFYRKLED